MNIVYTLSALAALTFIVVYITKFDWVGIIKNPYLSLIILGLAARIFAASLNEGYEVDINCFKAWSGMLADNGFGSFYSSDAFTDYPPGYMYVLFVIGLIRRILGLSYDSAAFTMLIKAPAVICDLITGLWIYKLASKRMQADNNNQRNFSGFNPYAWLAAIAYILNPAVIINSSVWGQVDAVYTLALIISIIYMSDKRYKVGFLSFAVAIMIKPQSLFFSPIYIYAAFDIVRSGAFKRQFFIRVLKYAAACAGLCFAIILPFVIRFEDGIVIDIVPVISQYAATIGSYPYASLNAYNFFSFIGANWRAVDTSFLFMNYSVFGTLCIIATVLLSFYLLQRGELRRANYFFVAAVINTLAFMFSTRMHERYLFPTPVFILIAFIEKEGSFSVKKIFLLLYTLFSITLFVNCADVINMLQNGNQAIYLQNTLPVLSAANLILTAIMLAASVKTFKPDDAYNPGITKASETSGSSETSETSALGTSPEAYIAFTPGHDKHINKRMNNHDYVLMSAITIVYAALAFYNLGDIRAPQTVWSPEYFESVIIDIPVSEDSGEARDINEIWYLNGIKNAQSFDIEFSETGEFDGEFLLNSPDAVHITTDSVYSWKNIFTQRNAKAMRITATSGQLSIVELALRINSELIPIIPRDESAMALADEQELVPERNTYMNSTIFDEIYHARTAYEFINGLDVLEWSHPPLGKVIISWGVRLFGMTPFGWRFTGALFGVLMLPIMYLLGKRMFGSTGMAFFATFLFSCDFMHYSQTRIATIDTYVTFFIMASFYFMYLYCDMEIGDGSFRRSLLYLALSGLFIGCAAASKWPGIYAAAGLALVFFISLYRRIRYDNLEVKRLIITLSLCLVFFIAVPVTIYLLSYIPYMRTPGKSEISSVINNQLEMFRYHSNVTQSHPFQSAWWQWPLNIRPLGFVYTDIKQGVKSAISTFGNPLVWWAGFVAVFYTLSAFSQKQNGKRDFTALFLLISFAAQFLPWTLVPRTTYIYHYFPSIPFIVLMTAYMFRHYFGARNKNISFGGVSIRTNPYAIAFAICVLITFGMFFPVISGMPVSVSYVHKFLRWLPSWQLM